MHSGLFDLKAELSRKEDQLKSKPATVQQSSNKTFQKISEITSKSRKKKNLKLLLSEQNADQSRKAIDDESVALYEKAKAKLEAKSKIYERMQCGSMEDFEDMYGETKFLVDFHRKYEDNLRLEQSSAAESDLRKEYATECSSIAEADERNRERMRAKWEQEQQELLDGPIHYENLKFDEIRNLGTGYFAFAKDEETRKKQMDDLKKLREETKTMQNKKENLMAKRKAALQKRLDHVKKRKLGSNDQDNELIISNVFTMTDAVITGSTIDTKQDTLTEHSKLDVKKNDIDKIIKSCRSDYLPSTREWDRGKETKFIRQPFVSSRSNTQQSATSRMERFVREKREERAEEFRPPDFY